MFFKLCKWYQIAQSITYDSTFQTPSSKLRKKSDQDTCFISYAKQRLQKAFALFSSKCNIVLSLTSSLISTSMLLIIFDLPEQSFGLCKFVLNILIRPRNKIIHNAVNFYGIFYLPFYNLIKTIP